ncbi:RHS repeat-associated core domain-containing protein [Pseudomonas sp. UC 17F4]|uniref:RHS repeat domain-containing protein n=1 Tax=Pseudomonas sp. UC 17F4 TaxID=1855328 RepID=UPI000884AABC|nr:RHS repeat-associated core domain-containing protein [Pseudomonas sp. UC 17F4]SDQ63374.1 RHS repeat-associated core domain-containing protein [Pseudomonas sp. UC 17F4]
MAFDPASARAKYQNRREAGPAWNQNEQRKLDQQYGCGNTLYGWDGDTLAFENRTHDLGARLTHYVYEPGTFVPVAQAVEHRSIKLLLEPVYDFPYDIERDPVWQHKPAPTPFDAFAWYQCDHLGTPMELTDEQGEVAWSGTYKAWGAAQEKRSDTAKRADIRNPLRFQGQYFDVETGLHYNRYRYYDPGVGRFVGKDPIGFAGGLNVYAYAPNPVEWVDPLGLAKKKIKASGTPKQAQTKVKREQAPSEIDRIDAPQQNVPHSQWHAHCPCGSGYNLDGSIHDKGRGDVTFSRKTIEWLNDHGWSIPLK